MATFLYRLGRLAARRAWAVVLIWFLLLAGIGAAAGTLGKPFTSELTIPGTEFQSVLDDLKAAQPESAGGSGTVLLRNSDGAPFTAAQRTAVADTVTRWKGIEGVAGVTDPFETQRSLDDASTKVTDGRAELADGRAQITSNEKKLKDAGVKVTRGQREIEQNAAKLADGRSKLEDASRQVASGRREIEANEAKLAAGQRELDANAARIAAGRAQIAANQRKITQGRAQLVPAKAKIAAGQKQLDAANARSQAGAKQLAAAKAQLADGQRRLDRARAQVQQGRAQVQAAQERLDALIDAEGEDSPAVQSARAELEQQRAQVDAAQEKVDAEAARLEPAQKQLAAQEAQVAAGTKRLAAEQAKLTAGARRLAAEEAKLTKGQAALTAGKARLDRGAAQLAAGQRRLDAGKARLAQGRAQLEAGARQVAANRSKLADGTAQLQSGREQIADARRQLADGRIKLADGRAKLERGALDLARGERRLALIDGLRTVNPEGTAAVARMSFDTSSNAVAPETIEAIKGATQELSAAGVRVDYSSDFSGGTSGLIGPGEVIGLVVAAIVLLVMLGSLVATGLPLITALVGVGVGLLGTVTLTHWVQMSDVTPMLALMLGLAVGIDYALFLVNRHREQLAEGLDLEESIGRATGTAGSAVTVAGLTVVVALAALTFSGIPFLGTMGLAAAATVAIAVLVSLTLTPALLRLIGHRVLSRGSRRAIRARLEAAEAAARAEDALEGAELVGDVGRTAVRHAERGIGWGGLVTRHPVVTLVASVLLLGLLAVPAASLRLGLPDGGSEPADSTAYQTYSTVAREFGEGQNAAVLAVAQVAPAQAAALTDGTQTDLQLDVAEKLRAIPGVAYVVPAGASEDKTRQLFQIVPTTGPTDEATTTLVHDLRDRRAGIVRDTGITSLGFAGATVANIDMSELLAAALPTYLAIVVGISLVLLLLVFRSLLVPILATAGFLLSIAASFGAVVAVYQWGWLGSFFGVDHPGPILSFLPTLAIGIVFGLAMDYQMFLVSGMREAWAHGHHARVAVRTGFSHGARVVTAAALIMTAVFGSFVFSHMAMIRPIGFALAAGVLFDAFVVRMTIMPAVMHLLGERAWYLPAWLDRILPHLDVEGTRLLEHLGARDGTATGSGGPDSSEDPGGGDATSQRQPEGSTA